MTDPMDRAPEFPLDFAEEERIKQANRFADQLRRQANPTPLLGVATEHSIEDPFIGQITVTVQL